MKIVMKIVAILRTGFLRFGILLLLLLAGFGEARAQTKLTLFPTINSVGCQVALPASLLSDKTLSASIRYRRSSGTWRAGFPPSLISVDSLRQFRGSIFMAEAATKYEIEITITDSLPTFHQSTLSDTITTLSDPTISPREASLYVSPDGNGTVYSRAQPGDIRALFATGLTCGQTVILLGGTYDIGEMDLSLKNDCTAGTPIVIMAEPGETVIFDAGDTTKYLWTPLASDSTIFSATIKPALAYNALCMLDSVRLYPYAFLTPPSVSSNYPSLATLGYDQSGFYRKSNLTYIKTLDHQDPNRSRTIFSKYLWCLNVDGAGKQNYLYLKGITFRYYNKGKSDLDVFNNPTFSYPSWTLRFTNASHIVVDSCTFLYANFPVGFMAKCNNNLVEHSSFVDGTGYWSHGAFKQTRDVNYLEPGSYGRYLENAGVFFSPGDSVTLTGNIIRYNTFRGIVSAVGMGFGQSYRMTEFDLYGNTVTYCYDGLDPTAACINTRLWNNEIGYCPVGISLILPTFGPTYIFRNVIHHIADRKNHNNDIFYVDCAGNISEKCWGTSLKLNAGGANPLPGQIFFMQNTIHSTDSLGFNMYLWNATWSRLQSRNNIFYSSGIANFMFDGIAGDSSYSFESRHDNYFNRASGTIAIVRPTHGVEICETPRSTTDLSVTLQNATGSNAASVYGFGLDPMFKDLAASDFHLSVQSPLIDKGEIIPGINDDFTGQAPDLGAFESDSAANAFVTNTTVAEDQLIVTPNPASASIEVTFREPLRQLKLIDITGKILAEFGPSSSSILRINIANLPRGSYFIEAVRANLRLRTKWIKD